jgi:glutamate decarboxylase
MPSGLDDVAVLRIVVRNGFSRDLAALLIEHLKHVVKRLATERSARPRKVSFHH